MKTPIHALLLAAGFGTRLRPLTLKTPKCLVTIAGQPLLEHWLQSLEACSCSDVLVNTHYLADQVNAFLEKRPKSKMNIKTIYEPELLGTAGTLLANQNFFEGSIGLLIHADNATNFNLNELIEAHQRRPEECLMTMLTFETETPRQCGIVRVGANGAVKSFHEKVDNPPGNRANGAVYIFENEFLKNVITKIEGAYDFSTDIIPKYLGKIYTYHTEKPYIDIGTPENLKKASDLLGTDKRKN